MGGCFARGGANSCLRPGSHRRDPRSPQISNHPHHLGTLAGIGVTLLLAVPASGLPSKRPTLDLGFQISQVWRLLISTLNQGPWGHVFRGEPWPGLNLASMVFVAGLVVGWILVLATPYLRAKLGRSNSVCGRTAYAAFLTLIISFLIIAMVATKETPDCRQPTLAVAGRIVRRGVGRSGRPLFTIATRSSPRAACGRCNSSRGSQRGSGSGISSCS